MIQKSAFLGSTEKKNESECFQLKHPEISTGFLPSGCTFKQEGPNQIHLFDRSIYNIETPLQKREEAFFTPRYFLLYLGPYFSSWWSAK